MSDSRLCACGRPINAGWANGSGGNHHECLICWTGRCLAGVRLQLHSQPARRPYIICRCCQTVGPHAGHGLIRSCYHREYRQK
jgi:hypothetical protein